MRITIDNLDGLGAMEYTGSVAAEGPITLQRGLNVPSRCTWEMVLGLGGLATPVRHARVVVTSEAGAVLFTGYCATEPVNVYAGAASMGAVYRARVTAVSDEWLLDRLGSGTVAGSLTGLWLSGGSLLQLLTARAQSGGPSVLSVASGGALQQTGAVVSRASAPWSENAALSAGAGYAAYRVLSGAVSVQTAGTVVHTFSDADGSLSANELATNVVRDLVNDVTISGAEEPVAYVQEIFEGDGTTTVFELSEEAFRETARTLVRESFNGPALNAAVWTKLDPGSHVSLGAGWLVLNGGTGTDGTTMVTAVDAMEMGGSVVVQLAGVSFGASSDGMLGGMYEGVVELANCFAGFRVRQSSGATVVVPVVNGAELGTVFTPVAGHLYTLRLRLHCVEQQRVPQVYYAMANGAVESFGSASGITAPMDVVFELVDEGVASNTPATVLYDSAAGGTPVASTPAVCTFVVANSTNLFGTVGAVSVTRPGSVWVVSTLPSGTVQTRLIGLAGQRCDCAATHGTSNGTVAKVTFYAGRVPVAGERVTVSYRARGRSVARLENAASVAAEAVGGAAGTSRWLGKVLDPPARTSVDCESAALAVLAFATTRSCAVSGEYKAVNPASDVWPGDVLNVTSDGVTTALLVRSVEIKDGQSAPEVLRYAMKFANDWATEYADGLGLKLSEAIAPDAYLPLTAATGSGQVLANLQQLAVTSLSTTAIGVSTGTNPPAGGGFEVRRADWQFGVSVDAADLVLRSPVVNFTIPRATEGERFYVRMYDASTPPLYSRFSSELVVNWPV
ncbi:hypothetical protein SAMN05421819_2160 [Bryocella elongata]|uniref:Uncharacterized protein n=1 Tax=Bryocella elongata TaxID=863522 RepID=A0A1H5Y8D0_9BACT|nr:hypothetical protein [Bryocella elongata]SEG19917.1 hypothetical protein SAMN05421819_2160 [Bryocella elongata]